MIITAYCFLIILLLALYQNLSLLITPKNALTTDLAGCGSTSGEDNQFEGQLWSEGLEPPGLHLGGGCGYCSLQTNHWTDNQGSQDKLITVKQWYELMDMSNVKYDICLTYLFNMAINYLLVKKTSKYFRFQNI